MAKRITTRPARPTRTIAPVETKPDPKPLPLAHIGVHDPENRQLIEDMYVNAHQHSERAHMDADHTIEALGNVDNTLNDTLEHHAIVHQTIKDNHSEIKDKLDETGDSISDKLDEVIQAIKEIPQPEEGEEAEPTDMTEVVDLLKDVLEELKQPCTITLELE